MMKSAVRQQRYKLKHEFFDPFPLHLVRKTSPVKSTSNEQWMALVESWKTPKKMVIFLNPTTLPCTCLFCKWLTCILIDVEGMPIK
jgi:hypothetical protein